jgi:hypothetical protein
MTNLDDDQEKIIGIEIELEKLTGKREEERSKLKMISGSV